MSFCLFLGLLLWHMEVPRLGVELELQPPAYTRAIAMPDTSCVCSLHHSSWQCWIFNPPSTARDQTPNLVVPSWICFPCATMGIPVFLIKVLQFSAYKSLTSLVRFIPRFVIFGGVILKGSAFLYSFSNISLSV